MKKCKLCNKEIPRKPHANNVKYCEGCREERKKYKYRKEYYNQWQRNKYGKYVKGKKQCLLCGKWYYKPMMHSYQTHGITEREYKDHFGLDRKSIIADTTKEKHQEANRQHRHMVVDTNLLEKGKKTRFRKGDPTIGRYKRSEETLKRLRRHIKNI